MDLTTEQVFAAITDHNRGLGDEDKFSTEPLRLVYRASNVQNMRFIDTPGIIANQVSLCVKYTMYFDCYYSQIIMDGLLLQLQKGCWF